MNFSKPHGNETELLEMYLPQNPKVVAKKMFGYPAAFIQGRMFMGTYNGQLILKLSPSDFENFTQEFHAATFEPLPGRPMTGFALVPVELIDNEPMLHSWVQKALMYVEALPPKKSYLAISQSPNKLPSLSVK